jgi:hypothetical protein
MALTGPSVQGTLVSDTGLPAAGITVRVYSIGFGGQETKLGETKTDSQGSYSISYTPAAGAAVHLQVRVLDPAGKEVTVSDTVFNAQPQQTLSLVVPASVQPMASEFDRLSADMDKRIGGIAALAKAEESASRQDLTLLSQDTGWDARPLALLAIAGQQAATTGLDPAALYALYRIGMPTDSQKLALVPVATVQAALTKASKAGIVNLNDQQISAAASAFQKFSVKTRLAMTAEGCVSSFGDLLPPPSLGDTSKFVDLYFTNVSVDGDFWNQAAKLGLPAQTLQSLRTQAPFLYLGKNNLKLAQKLQADIGTIASLPKLADLDYHKQQTWVNVLTTLAGSGGDPALAALIPPRYTGAATKDRLTAYAGDMARLVLLSFPTQCVARMFEAGDLAMTPAVPVTQAVRTKVANFLRSAGTLGFQLGRTPLNAFLRNHDGTLPALDDPSVQSLKILHRLYQVTPSTESLQAALQLGFKSASDIASHSKADFMAKYAHAFPSGEAELVYGQAQMISAVTFNIFSMAKGLDTSAPLYALSPANGDRQNAKNALVQRFPSMQNLFGNLDFCQCEDCRSVLSPAAYFVDLLDMLGQQSAPNAANNTPLDVLIGKNGFSGRRPDLGALPLTCANTNTAMPYIDLVNEIFEYYIAHNNTLDAGAAYDTGSAITADLTAEPQHIAQDVYTNKLSKAVYPLSLPFDLWIETVRGFLNYFKISLAQVLETFRRADHLELFTDGHSYPYYRAQILAEALGISPEEYSVFTATDTTKWFSLYGYANEAAAVNDLKSAKTLSQKLGVTYQEITDLVKTGFLNPGLYPLIFQFERFDIDMATAFRFTNQPGYPSLGSEQTTAFQALLDGITVRYKQQNPHSTFDAKTWLTSVLTAKYSSTVLVLADPNAGCDFTGTTLRYADGSPAQPLDFLKFNLFVRLWKRLGWSMEETDRALQTFSPAGLPAFSDPGFAKAFGDAWKTALVYLAHLDDLNTCLAPALGRVALLPLWADLPTQGENSLYAQLFLAPSVLNGDFAFDDPNGRFPVPAADLTPQQAVLSAHGATIQGALSLKADEIDAILHDAGITPPAQLSLANLSLCYRYSVLAQCLQLSMSDMIAVKALSGLNPFQKPAGAALKNIADDVLFNQTLAFVKQVGTVQNSGFTVEDLKYLLRHQFDPVGKYQSDPNALMTLIQSVASRLQQIQSQNAGLVGPTEVGVPASAWNAAATYIPGQVVIQGGITYICSATATNQAPPNPTFWNRLPASALAAWNPAVAYSPGQIVTKDGACYICRSGNTNQAPPNAAFWQIYVLSPSLTSVPESLIDQSMSRLLPATTLKSLFALLADSRTYTASQGGVSSVIDPAPFVGETKLGFNYDSTTQTQYLSYKGLLLDWKKAELKAIKNSSPVFSSLLDGIQTQAQTALGQSVGDILGAWASLVEYEAARSPVAAAIPPDPLQKADPALRLSFDATGKLEWVGYRGVLTDAKTSALVSVNNSSDLQALLTDVQGQALPQYSQLIGTLLVMWLNAQTFTTTQAGVAAADQIEVDSFAASLAAAQQSGIIVDPVPQLQFAYDDASQRQTRICQGALTDSMRAQLTDLIPSAKLWKTLFSNLLQDTRNQAIQLFQVLATNLITLAPADLDNYLQPFLGLDAGKQQKLIKADLVSVFAPLLARKLSRQLVLQTLSESLGSDASLTEALVTNAALLNDPSNPGKSLLQSFLAAGQPGVSASYYSSPNPVGTPQAAGIAATADTADPTNSKPGTASAHFEGYLQVPTDGPYRFFAELGDVGAAASLTIDSPEPTALLKNPIIPSSITAAKAGDEVSQFVSLQAGIAYHFTLDFTNLGAQGAKLLVQGETLSKGPLSQLVLLPQQTIDSFIRAKVLLSKVVQIVQVMGLDVREVSYLSQHAEDFNNLVLSSIPTEASDDSAAKAAALFSQFLTLADYADLRKSLAGGTDGLVSVFQAAQQPADAATLLAGLTRRDPQVVQDVAAVLGTDPHFSNNVGSRRMWEALQLVHVLGLPVKSIGDATAIVSANASSPDISANFKNAVKAQYNTDQWRPIAQSVFDPLRRKKRDALASYLVNVLELESANQLFEYFLVDPGMEPVVQTSRLRLALSSVQSFIQRCLLNLEDGNSDAARNVSASSIPADWWAWMKRYRVWQANREIFLFPENWMQPELRQDKTDLFQALESALLQGDVTRDLVENAFADYLKGLELRARLDIVASYFDQNMTNPGESTLYALGRTYGHPHKYFFRTYAFSTGTWSNWEPVTFDIEGDHIVPVVWRGRLNLFWVTFLVKASPSTGGFSFRTLADQTISSADPDKQVQLQLHWSEYSQGKWSNRISTDLSRAEVIATTPDFDPNHVHVHVSKEFTNGEEGAVRIHVDLPHVDTQNDGEHPSLLDPRTFRVTGKNCDPDFSFNYWENPPFVPYVPYTVVYSSPTEFPAAGSLTASFQNAITPGGSSITENEAILDTVNNFDLSLCANPVVPAFVDPGDPLYWQDGGLVSPFFFSDASNPSVNGQNAFRDERTFFVQPSLTETLIHEWRGWAIPPSSLAENWADPKILDHINVVSLVPLPGLPLMNAQDFVHSVVPMQTVTDWVTDPRVAISYGGVAVGKTGGFRTLGPVISAGTRPVLTGVSVLRSGGVVVVGSQGLNVTEIRPVRPVAIGPGNFARS